MFPIARHYICLQATRQVTHQYHAGFHMYRFYLNLLFVFNSERVPGFVSWHFYRRAWTPTTLFLELTRPCRWKLASSLVQRCWRSNVWRAKRNIRNIGFYTKIRRAMLPKIFLDHLRWTKNIQCEIGIISSITSAVIIFWKWGCSFLSYVMAREGEHFEHRL